MPFVKGQSGNPHGRKPGAISPITRAKTIILQIFSENQEKFVKDLKEEIKNKGPIPYFFKFIVPFMPKELSLSGELDLGVKEKSKDDVLSRIDELSKELDEPTKKVKRGKSRT